MTPEVAGLVILVALGLGAAYVLTNRQGKKGTDAADKLKDVMTPPPTTNTGEGGEEEGGEGENVK